MGGLCNDSYGLSVGGACSFTAHHDGVAFGWLLSRRHLMPRPAARTKSPGLFTKGSWEAGKGKDGVEIERHGRLRQLGS